MTLGDLKYQGKTPSADQIFFLELEESRRCRAFGGNQPHRYHCYMRSDGSVVRELCWELDSLWDALERMFPGIELDRK
jgi:hypothetical protein